MNKRIKMIGWFLVIFIGVLVLFGLGVQDLTEEQKQFISCFCVSLFVFAVVSSIEITIDEKPKSIYIIVSKDKDGLNPYFYCGEYCNKGEDFRMWQKDIGHSKLFTSKKEAIKLIKRKRKKGAWLSCSVQVEELLSRR